MSYDMIRRDALLEFARNHIDGKIDCNDIARFPYANAEPVRHGRWILSGPDLHGNIRPKCSVCGRYRLAQWADHIKCNYCPECGANMRGDNDAAD